LEYRNPKELADDDDMDDLENEEGEEDADEGDAEAAKDEDQASSDDKDDTEDDNNEDVQELRRKIEETLKINGIEAATGNSDEESEDLMDDDQMMAIDEQIAQVFRLRMNEKKSFKG
jgi:DNA polymerase phi